MDSARIEPATEDVSVAEYIEGHRDLVSRRLHRDRFTELSQAQQSIVQFPNGLRSEYQGQRSHFDQKFDGLTLNLIMCRNYQPRSTYD